MLTLITKMTHEIKVMRAEVPTAAVFLPLVSVLISRQPLFRYS